jgi:hypothetical protein
VTKKKLKKKRINKLAKHLRKEYGIEFIDACNIARALLNGRFYAHAWKWFRTEEEWVALCARGCCRGPSGRGLYIYRREDCSELVLNSDDIKYLENFSGE